MSDLAKTLQDMQLDYLAHYASGGTIPLPDEPLTDARLFALRNTATQILVTGGELAEGVSDELWGQR